MYGFVCPGAAVLGWAGLELQPQLSGWALQRYFGEIDVSRAATLQAPMVAGPLLSMQQRKAVQPRRAHRIQPRTGRPGMGKPAERERRRGLSHEDGWAEALR